MKCFNVAIMSLNFIGALSLTVPASAQDAPPLSRDLVKIHDKIETRHPQLSHVSAAEMERLLQTRADDLLILDVRKPDEYAVSHIDGALRVDPGMSPEDFMAQYGEKISGKDVVLYCSVGRRSSNLGARLQSALMDRGAASVSNLEGGVFGWHNQSRALVSPHGQTDKVHPYNRWWGRLVARKEGIAYDPAASEPSSTP